MHGAPKVCDICSGARSSGKGYLLTCGTCHASRHHTCGEDMIRPSFKDMERYRSACAMAQVVGGGLFPSWVCLRCVPPVGHERKRLWRNKGLKRERLSGARVSSTISRVVIELDDGRDAISEARLLKTPTASGDLPEIPSTPPPLALIRPLPTITPSPPSLTPPRPRNNEEEEIAVESSLQGAAKRRSEEFCEGKDTPVKRRRVTRGGSSSGGSVNALRPLDVEIGSQRNATQEFARKTTNESHSPRSTKPVRPLVPSSLTLQGSTISTPEDTHFLIPDQRKALALSRRRNVQRNEDRYDLDSDGMSVGDRLDSDGLDGSGERGEPNDQGSSISGRSQMQKRLVLVQAGAGASGATPTAARPDPITFTNFITIPDISDDAEGLEGEAHMRPKPSAVAYYESEYLAPLGTREIPVSIESSDEDEDEYEAQVRAFTSQPQRRSHRQAQRHTQPRKSSREIPSVGSRRGEPRSEASVPPRASRSAQQHSVALTSTHSQWMDGDGFLLPGYRNDAVETSITSSNATEGGRQRTPPDSDLRAAMESYSAAAIELAHEGPRKGDLQQRLSRWIEIARQRHLPQGSSSSGKTEAEEEELTPMWKIRMISTSLWAAGQPARVGRSRRKTCQAVKLCDQSNVADKDTANLPF